MKHLLTLIALTAMVPAALAQTVAVVADFNDIPMTASATTRLGPNGWTVELIPCCTHVENGFQFDTAWSATKFAMPISAVTSAHPNWWTGSQTLFHAYGGSAQYTNSFDITRVGGGSFDFISMDVAAFSNASRSMMVVGYRANGDRVQQYVPLLDDSYNTLQTLTFGDDFKNLAGVTFSAWGQQIDNLTFGVAAAVPEPTTHALLLAGLGLVGLAARRRA